MPVQSDQHPCMYDQVREEGQGKEAWKATAVRGLGMEPGGLQDGCMPGKALGKE